MAEALEVHLSSVSKYLSGNREPDAGTCLLLATLARDPQDRQFFIDASGLSLGQLAKISSMLARNFDRSTGREGFCWIEVPETQVSYVKALIEYFQSPAESLSNREVAFRTAMAAVLKAGKRDRKS
jgi:hypothetical protein